MNIQAVKNLVKCQKKRPILQCLHYEENRIIVTNAYSLIIETQRLKVETPFNIDTNTMTLNPDSYPNIDMILPKQDSLTDVISIDKVIHANEIYYQINQGSEFLFAKDLLEQTFKCLDYKDILSLPLDNFKITLKGSQLVYQDNNQYLMILADRIGL